MIIPHRFRTGGGNSLLGLRPAAERHAPPPQGSDNGAEISDRRGHQAIFITPMTTRGERTGVAHTRVEDAAARLDRRQAGRLRASSSAKLSNPRPPRPIRETRATTDQGDSPT